ncbi:heavy-metal-associated domain-containing protein [Gemelliphila palaticanis]|uniref:Heavy-metal-associated domain-containing protein n=1 Tax=Gemelliphila palaticanis TaxID=81950 RepID=A0ABX2T178_9BACL|nr:heavy metal-associated domain-containing protein [Gemella palaticanis]MBF0716193.1 heavy-metal-associated domain-containing protein [Gemella palaticanis]NYS48123.1 heavy-metal-associated domain-containing protein [Gemella palaticanis]
MINKYKIEGLKCQGCVNIVTNKILELENIEIDDINIDLEKSELTLLKNVKFDVLEDKIKETKFKIFE